MIATTWFPPWMVWGAAVFGLSALLGLQTLRLSDERASHALTKSDHSAHVALLERQTREAVEDARNEEKRRRDKVQEIADETQEKLDVALADAGAARDAGERLRQRVAQLTTALGRATASQSSAADPGAPAQTTADLLADVQRRLDAAADTIAGFADKSHLAGLACERSYQALTPAPGGQ